MSGRGGRLQGEVRCRRFALALLVSLALAASVLAGAVRAEGLLPLGAEKKIPRLPSKPAPYLGDGQIPARPALPLELGAPFLSTGNLYEGFTLPGGAVWQPRLWVFGTLRTALQSIDDGINPRTTEWANRLDVFANLQLTGTERVLIGLRPLDKNRSRQFSGYTIEPAGQRGWEDDTNANIRTLFFEGDFGSLFPNLDALGMKPIDYGFSVGRQPLLFQNGILINDTVDALGIVRNNLHVPGTSNLRVTGIWGWSGLDRPVGPGNSNSTMLGLFSAADLPKTTLNLDLIYVGDRASLGDAFYVGGAATQRLGLINTTFRANSSIALNRTTAESTNGTLLSAEISWTPHRSDDIVYIDPYVAIGNFTQAGREPINGGPLAPLGILYAGSGIGTIKSLLSSSAHDVAGFAMGYQAFWDNHRRNLVLEVSARKDMGKQSYDAAGFGAQLQQAIGQRVLWTLFGGVAAQAGHDPAYAMRTEFLIQF